MSKLKITLATLITLGTSMSMNMSANAWNATYLQGQNWAITCANGQSFSYNGSSAGLDTVGPALCPDGIAGPNGGNILTEMSKLEGQALAAGFPPHGYPCLGCEPCPGDPTEFCSTTDGISGEGTVVWSLSGMDAKTKKIMANRYKLNESTKINRPPPRERPRPRQQRR